MPPRKLAEQVRQELDVPPVEIGIMVEVPSTVLMAPEFAKEARFLLHRDERPHAIHAGDGPDARGAGQERRRSAPSGSANDRHDRPCRQGRPESGSAYAVASRAIRSALRFSPDLGVAELSMSLPSIAAVKASLRKIRLTDAQNLARRALACSTAFEVRQLSH